MPFKTGAKTDGAGLQDSITVELNGAVIEGEFTLPSLPPKPTASSPKSAWEEFAIGNGLSPETAASWSKDELIKWIG
jgi:hypothetical protein